VQVLHDWRLTEQKVSREIPFQAKTLVLKKGESSDNGKIGRAKLSYRSQPIRHYVS